MVPTPRPAARSTIRLTLEKPSNPSMRGRMFAFHASMTPSA
jgi:hypothetical protein